MDVIRPSWTPLLALPLLLTCTGALPAADDQGTPETLMQAYRKAVAEADTVRMADFYAPEVTVLRGSTLLDKRFGGLGGEAGRDRDQKVKKEVLLKAYARAIDAFGGKEQWVKRGERSKDAEIEFVSVQSVMDRSQKAKEQMEAIAAKPDDTLAIVNPKGDSRVYLLRKGEGGKWLILAEHWD